MNKIKFILWLLFIGCGANAQIAMPSMRGVFNTKVPTTMYSGGVGEGNNQQTLTQGNCIAPSLETIYYGGNGTGYDEQQFIQSTCAYPLLETIYFGGASYGNVAATLLKHLCSS